MNQQTEQTKPAEHTLWKVLEESDKLRAERNELLELCNAMRDRLETNNGKAILSPIQQRGWAAKFRAVIKKAEATL